MAFDLQLEQAKYLQGIHDVKALPVVAQNALEAGYDSRSLRMLAGMEKPTNWDAEPLWFRALDELGATHLTKSDALEPVVDWVIAEWTTGNYQLRVAASILQRLCAENDYDIRLTAIYTMAEYVQIGVADEKDLIEQFQRFRLRDFDQHFFAGPIRQTWWRRARRRLGLGH